MNTTSRYFIANAIGFCQDESINELALYLERIRASYLSLGKRVANHGPNSANQQLTDKQRDDIDYETKMIIQQTLMRIRSLEDLERERLNKEAKNAGGISSFFVDMKQEEMKKTTTLHRAGMLWFLNDKLKRVSDRHSAQQEIRLSRQVEKTKSMLHNVGEETPLSSLRDFKPKRHSPENHYTENELPEVLRDLTPQQITQLETENNELLNELELSLNKAKAAEKSLYEISQIQSQLATHLSTQNEMIESLLDDAFQVHDDVSRGNQQLESAKTRNRRTSKIIISLSIFFAFILLFFDAITS